MTYVIDRLSKTQKQALTAYPKMYRGKQREWPVYAAVTTKQGQGYLVPRFWAAKNGYSVPISLPTNQQTYVFTGKLRADQLDCANNAIDALVASGGVFINGKCGSGKTVVAEYLISCLRPATTLIAVDQLNLVYQWVERILQFLDFPGKIGLWIPETAYANMLKKLCQSYEKAKDKVVWGNDAQIVIGTDQTIRTKVSPNNRFKVDLFIVDEVHVFSAETVCPIAFGINYRLSIGLSADTQRTDGLQWVFEYLIGDKVIPLGGQRMPASIEFVSTQISFDPRDYIEVKCRPFKIMTPAKCIEVCPHAPGTPGVVDGDYDHDMTGLVMALTTDNKYKNHMLKILIELFEEGRNIIAYSRPRAWLTDLMNALPPHIKKETAVYTGGMKQEAAIEACSKQLTLATFGVAAKGLDVPHKDTAVFMTPSSNPKQPAGRVERYLAGKLPPKVIIPLQPVRALLLMAKKCYSYFRRQNYKIQGASLIYGGLNENTGGERRDKLSCILE